MTAALEDPPRRGATLDRLLVLALMGLYAAGYAYATVLTDTARDVGAGWRIATGEELPLLGPYVGGRWRLGPAWFYALAALVAVGRSTTAVALGVGALASLKLPLAYALGRRVSERAGGLGFVALLALPGWGSLEQVLFTHFNLVQAGVLATLLAAHAARRAPSALRFLLLGLALSLALHAHPTAIVAAPFAAAAWWGARRARAAGALAAGLVLPLAPMLVSEARTGFGQIASTAEFVGAGGFAARLARAPALLVRFLINDVAVASDLLAPLGVLGKATAAASAAALGLGFAAALCVRGRVPRRARALAAAYFAASVCALSALRHPASMYLFYATLPFGAGVAALGWAALSERLAPPRRALPGLALAALALVASAALLAAREAAWRDGWQRLPGAALGHVGAAAERDGPPGDLLPVFALDALGRAACAAPGGLSVHGDAATLLELAQGLPAWLACGPREDLYVGGHAAPLAGYPAGLWRAAGAALPDGARGYVWFRELEAFGAGGHRVRLYERYPPYVWTRKPVRPWSRSAQVAAGDWIAVTQLNPQLVRTREPELSVGGAAVEPAARTANTWLFAVRTAGLARLRVETDDPSWLDVVRLRADRARVGP